MEGITSSSSYSYVPIFLPLFIFFYLFGYFVIFPNSSPKRRPEDSSCFMSFAHGTPAAIMAFLSIMAYPQSGFATLNTSFQNMVLDFSISYFLADLLHYFIFFPSDVLFIGHHLATLFVFITCRYVVTHGAFALLVLLILAEVTSFCQNAWTLASSRRANSHMAAKVYDVLSPFFYSLYTLVRGFAGPVFVYKMGLFFLSGEADRVIPRWMWISWMVVIVGAISVSILWILNLWLELFKERSSRSEKKD